MTAKLPPSASVALPTRGAMLHAPAADRNKDALCDLLTTVSTQGGSQDNDRSSHIGSQIYAANNSITREFSHESG